MSADAQAEIKSRNASFRRATLASDAAALAQVYTESAWLLPHGEPMLQGRVAIERFWQARFARIAETNPQTVDLLISGVHAREVGKTTVLLKDGQQVERKYVIFWQKVADIWLIETHMINGDK